MMAVLGGWGLLFGSLELRGRIFPAQTANTHAMDVGY